ncbi:MAG: DUF2167 domain-containing protein [Candidatus Sumerlaeia bacterium]
MKILTRALATFLLFANLAVFAQDDADTSKTTVEKIESQLKLKFQKGPGVGNLGGAAEIKIPEGFVFLEAKDTQTLLEAMENPTGGDELGFIAPASLDWFVVFEFDDSGYVKDDEKGNLDADKMLESMKRGNKEGNKERKRRGWAELNLIGWEIKPAYNDQTHNLEWAIKCESAGKMVINHNTRVLGRKGVMEVTLVAGPEELAPNLPKFREVLTGFDYKSGNKYAEYRQGDKIAEYGLTALVVGGASAVALKSGAFKGLWKLIVLAIAGIGGLLGKLFGRKSE